MKIQDAIFNWLQIAVVYEGRPSDTAAKETRDFFREILLEDHQIEEISYERDALAYTVTYKLQNGEINKKTFDLNFVDKLLDDIEKEPKYN